MSKYCIDIILDKPEISTDFKVICHSEVFDGKKSDAVKRAESLKKEWNADFCNIYKETEGKKVDEKAKMVSLAKINEIEIKAKLESGDLRLFETPILYYLVHHEFLGLPVEVVAFVLDELEIKTIGEFVDRYSAFVRGKLIKAFPELESNNQIIELDHKISDAIMEVCDIQDLVKGLHDD